MKLERWLYYYENGDMSESFYDKEFVEWNKEHTDSEKNPFAMRTDRFQRVYIMDADEEDKKRCSNCNKYTHSYCLLWTWDCPVCDEFGCKGFEKKDE